MLQCTPNNKKHKNMDFMYDDKSKTNDDNILLYNKHMQILIYFCMHPFFCLVFVVFVPTVVVWNILFWFGMSSEHFCARIASVVILLD